MGYDVSQKVYTLVFEEPHEYAGVSVTLLSIPIGKLLKVMRGATELGDSASTPISSAMSGMVTDMFVILAKSLVKWNLLEDGEPIPPVFAQCRESGKPIKPGRDFCAEHDQNLISRRLKHEHPEAEYEPFDDDPEPCDATGVMGLDAKLVGEITEKWVQVVMGVDPTLPRDSNFGGTFPEASIPMTARS